jgi:catechol 2,3-dioxygenase-like lactoylglutathione lyase family enzyme
MRRQSAASEDAKMAINGIETLVYGVDDVGRSTHFFEDFGLSLAKREGELALFQLDEGSKVEIRPMSDPTLPASPIVGNGVREVIWGVDTQANLEALAADLGRDHKLRRNNDGSFHFVPYFGIPMGFRVYAKKTVAAAPDPVNAPGKINRLNQHRKWRRRARPKVLQHVVFQVPDYQGTQHFMLDRLGFRLSDVQEPLGYYLRAGGTNNHHNFLLLNANAPIPGCDGLLRFHHANFGVEDIDELMVGVNHMLRQGWEASEIGLGRHRIDSALFYYLPCPGGGEAEYGTDSDYIDDSWVPRRWIEPMFAYSIFTHNLPPFLKDAPDWKFEYLETDAAEQSTAV